MWGRREHNHTNENINKFKMKVKWKEKKAMRLSLLKGNAQNITTNELILNS